MADKKPREKPKMLPETEKAVAEITAARKRTFEPFIKCFSFTGENVTKLDLGTLIGVFEVSERSEDSAYIVNFLASVAKKEYFSNGRRGAVESFEASLQKINLALAELVKHGNIAWLGNLHGALGVLEKNNVHFSVTGGSRILLLRNGTVMDISEGLSSEESATHPIKTFIEVSSGRLSPDDRLIFGSPGVFSLFSPETLLKNSLRMEGERFNQFLRTALINELDIAGALVIEVREGETLPKRSSRAVRRTAAAETPVSNVFSQAAFSSKPELPPEPVETDEEEAEEYVDSKTGHIYVQGTASSDSPAHPALEQAGFYLHEAITWCRDRAIGFQQRVSRRTRKKAALVALSFSASLREGGERAASALERGSRTLSRAARVAAREASASMKGAWNKAAAAQAQKRSRRTALSATDEIAPLLPLPGAPAYPEEGLVIEDAVPASSEPHPPATFQPQSRLSSFYARGKEEALLRTASQTSGTASPRSSAAAAYLPRLRRFGSAVRTGTYRTVAILLQHSRRSVEGLRARYGLLSPREKRFAWIGGTLAILLASGSIAAWLIVGSSGSRSGKGDGPSVGVGSSVSADAGTARVLEPHAVATASASIVSSAILGDEVYIVTRTSVVDVDAGKEYPVPISGGNIAYATPMPDLGLIFVMSDRNELFAWSPINHAFTKNSLPLPEGATVGGVGTYLTYLYVLDRAGGQIYRFPRADGGFGEASRWLKDSVSLTDETAFTVNERIYVSSTGHNVLSLFRGKQERELQSPEPAPDLRALAAPDTAGTVIGLDASGGRILLWNQDGALKGEYRIAPVGSGSSLSYLAKTGEILVSEDRTLSSYKLEDISLP